MSYIISVNKDNPDHSILRYAAEVLKKGGILAYPTDTIYGIGCDIFQKNAVENIFAIKKRGLEKGVSFICSDFNMLSKYTVIDSLHMSLLKKVLPGCYTFILKASDKVPNYMKNIDDTIGIRMPNSIISLLITEMLNSPLISTSANISGEEVLQSASDIDFKFKDQIDLILDAGELTSLSSSVIDLSKERAVIVRKGKGDVSMFK